MSNILIPFATAATLCSWIATRVRPSRFAAWSSSPEGVISTPLGWTLWTVAAAVRIQAVRKASKANDSFAGRWRITWMANWDQEFVDEDVEG